MIEQSYDSGDEGQVKKRKTKVQRQADLDNEDLRVVLSTAGGRRFVWRLLHYCGLWASTSVGDPQTMAVKSGHRDIALWILDEMKHAEPQAFLKMQSDASEEDIL